jgi:hypothetical protein
MAKREKMKREECKLCGKPLNRTGFCFCVAKDDEYVNVPEGIPGIRAGRRIDKDAVPGIIRRYRQAVGLPMASRRAQGGAIDKKKAFYASWEWKQARYQAFLRYGRKCMCCGAAGEGAKLVVDHIKPISKFWDIRLDPENLQILCNACNMGKSKLDYTDFRPRLQEG